MAEKEYDVLINVTENKITSSLAEVARRTDATKSTVRILKSILTVRINLNS